MTNWNRLLLMVVVILLSSTAAPSRAAPPTVSGGGVVNVERRADRLRMNVQLTATAPTLKEALAALQVRRTEARAKLEKLGADMATVHFSEPAVNDNSVNPPGSFSVPTLAPQPYYSSGPIAPAIPPPVDDYAVPSTTYAPATPSARASGRAGAPAVVKRTVSVLLTGDWPLAAESHEQSLLAVDELEKKIEAADLAGLKEKKPLTAEEKELAEEAAGRMPPSYIGPTAQQPGKPQFIFVARLSDDECAKAMAEAFAKAKARAAQTASAAGATLGPLMRVDDASSNGPMVSDGGEFYAISTPPPSPYGVTEIEPAEGERFSRQAGAVKFQIRVSADFELK